MEHSHHFISGTNTRMCTCIMYLGSNELVSEAVLRLCSDSPPLSRLIFLSRDSVTLGFFFYMLARFCCVFLFIFFGSIFVFICMGSSEFPLCFACTGRCVGFYRPGGSLGAAVLTPKTPKVLIQQSKCIKLCIWPSVSNVKIPQFKKKNNSKYKYYI